MKAIIFLLFSLICFSGFSSTTSDNNYADIFGEDYISALLFVEQNNLTENYFTNDNINPNFATAIIFPELIRYSAIRDIIEVSALKTLYIQFGKRYSDFSIGYFQMKPSFVEKLEKIYVKANVNNEKSKVFDISSTAKARKERILRMDSLNWQIRYLILFIKITEARFHNESFDNETDKLKFFATAYNLGFSKPASEIREKVNSCFFNTELIPLEATKKYCYSDISVYYFKNNLD